MGGLLDPKVARFVVVGGGIIGLSTARELLYQGARNVTVLEAEVRPNEHQTGRNSGVVHAGLFYRPGSLKATLCKKGLNLTKEYCSLHGLEFRSVGKLVVALNETQRAAAKLLFENAVANEVPGVRFLSSSKAIQDIEPIAAGVAAVYSPYTAIVDWQAVANRICDEVRGMGGIVMPSAHVAGFASNRCYDLNSIDGKGFALRVVRGNGAQITIDADRIITCAGVYSDRVAQSLGGSKYPVIVPIRGEYLSLNAPPSLLPHTNIYPLPPTFHRTRGGGHGRWGKIPWRELAAPFLGVHFTPTISGDVVVGPNAVPAFSRTGYRWTDVDFYDLYDLLSSAGVWKLCWHHGAFALEQMCKSLYLKFAVQDAIRYIPALEPAHFARRNPRHHGIRAQAISRDGSLVDDFVVESIFNDRILHVRNAPSPAATSAFAIAQVIAKRSIGSVRPLF